MEGNKITSLPTKFGAKIQTMYLFFFCLQLYSYMIDCLRIVVSTDLVFISFCRRLEGNIIAGGLPDLSNTNIQVL